MSDRAPRDSIPYCHIVRACCAHCGSLRLKVYKSIDQGDGSLLQYSRCRDCGGKTKILCQPFHSAE